MKKAYCCWFWCWNSKYRYLDDIFVPRIGMRPIFVDFNSDFTILTWVNWKNWYFFTMIVLCTFNPFIDNICMNTFILTSITQFLKFNFIYNFMFWFLLFLWNIDVKLSIYRLLSMFYTDCQWQPFFLNLNTWQTFINWIWRKKLQ